MNSLASNPPEDAELEIAKLSPGSLVFLVRNLGNFRIWKQQVVVAGRTLLPPIPSFPSLFRWLCLSESATKELFLMANHFLSLL